MHAAGHHRERPSRRSGARTVLDRVVSSYTPTVRALGYARERAARPDRPGTSLIVAGSPDLERAADEAAALLSRLPSPVLLADPDLPGDVGRLAAGPATRARVLEELPGCSVLHVACHAESDLVDPSRSRLLLTDHRSAPFTVAGLAPVTLDGARLAYLSACRTAVTDNAELIDESIHLVSAFQLAGFPQVVGTLWEIEDGIAAGLAQAFYARLTTGPPTDRRLDTRRAAEALHRVTLDLRGRLPDTPSLWAGYLHSGS
ncbi:CHAT domain-containing protein [Streptomyces sp. NPDC007896]|uniref:CHAT domain-containing protein n=1 Tax=Streptomyces sp. NPDC007896 TaxID=3364784 RepID=UPI0036EE05C1